MTAVGKEPERVKAFADGFLYLPTAGMRLAPEVLVLELMREVCFATSGGATSTTQASAQKFAPDAPESASHFSCESEAAAYALRGRRVERGGGTFFYAPAYPRFAGLGWLRRKTDRVVRDFFLRGALAQGTSQSTALRERIVASTVRAIYGSGQLDVMKLCDRKLIEAADPLVEAEAQAHLLSTMSGERSWGLDGDDAISAQIATDWHSLCLLEPHLPRVAWIGLTSTFMRVAVPIWLLAQLRVTTIVRDAMRSALAGGPINVEDVRNAIAHRHHRLLVPSLTLTDSVDDAVISYMRARIEINLLLAEFGSSDLQWKTLISSPLALEEVSGCLALGDVLNHCRTVGARNPGILVEILRLAERFPAWSSPLREGQGKNIEEFLRVLRNDHVSGSDDGYLLERGPKNRRLFKVFPAAKILSMYALLTHASSSIREGHLVRLVLSDVETSFRGTGIDFGAVGGSRSHLLKALASSGILQGTPDAGEGVELKNPYQGALQKLLKAN